MRVIFVYGQVQVIVGYVETRVNFVYAKMCVIFIIHVLSALKEGETMKHIIEEEKEDVRIFILKINWIIYKDIMKWLFK